MLQGLLRTFIGQMVWRGTLAIMRGSIVQCMSISSFLNIGMHMSEAAEVVGIVSSYLEEIEDRGVSRYGN